MIENEQQLLAARRQLARLQEALKAPPRKDISEEFINGNRQKLEDDIALIAGDIVIYENKLFPGMQSD